MAEAQNDDIIKQNKRKQGCNEMDGSKHRDEPALKRLKLSSISVDSTEEALGDMFLDRPLACINHSQDVVAQDS